VSPAISPAPAPPADTRPANSAKPPGVESVVVLVVGENLKSRSLLTSILGAFGVGAVLRAVSGANALELFHEMRRRPERVGVSGLDLVMADWEMTRIDGAGLLRWIRRHPESPDPFLPFIAMSTAPSQDQVRAARDLGANQFIARPFTVEALCEHLDSLTGDSRNYVQISDYFGPDRRHHDVPVELDLRGDEGVVRPGVRLLVAPKRLAAKLGGRFEPEPRRLAEARNKLDAWHDEFMAAVENGLARAESRFADIELSPDAEARVLGLADLNTISHHLHGYGRSFGSPLVITLSRSLHQLTGQTDQIDRDYLELVRAHLDALQAVLKLGLRSEGTKTEHKLVHELHRANRKLVRRAAERRLRCPG
jgi:CheY-like chemotaxis protein